MESHRRFTLLEVASAVKIGLRIGKSIADKALEKSQQITQTGMELGKTALTSSSLPAEVPLSVAQAIVNAGFCTTRGIVGASLTAAESVLGYIDQSLTSGVVSHEEEMGIVRLLDSFLDDEALKVVLDPLEKWRALNAWLNVQEKVEKPPVKLIPYEPNVPSQDFVQERGEVKQVDHEQDYDIIDVEMGTESSELHQVDELQLLQSYMNLCSHVYGPLLNQKSSKPILDQDSIAFESKDASPLALSYHPTYLLVTHHTTDSIVLVLRGTFSLHDVLIDLHGKSTTFNFQNQTYNVHKGMFKAASVLANPEGKLMKEVKRLLTLYPFYSFTIVGHSLGGGIGTLLSLLVGNPETGMTVEPLPKRRLKCFAYGSAATLDLNLATRPGLEKIVTTIIVDDDFIPQISRGAIVDMECIFAELIKGDTGYLRQIESGNYNAKEIYPFLLKSIPNWATTTRLDQDFRHPKLYVGGRILWFNDKGRWIVENVKDISELQPSKAAAKAHLPGNYLAKIR